MTERLFRLEVNYGGDNALVFNTIWSTYPWQIRRMEASPMFIYLP